MAIADALARQIPRVGDEVLSAYLSDFADNKAVIQSPDDTIRLNYKGEVTELIQKDARLCFDQAFRRLWTISMTSSAISSTDSPRPIAFRISP